MLSTSTGATPDPWSITNRKASRSPSQRANSALLCHVCGLSLHADVKPGHGVQIVDLQMQDELGVQPYHAVQVGLCEHIKAGGSSCGLTAGLMDPLVYELRLSCDAVFEGHVGDIPPVYWAPWRYGFGMALYLRDHPDFMPLFVQTYWTDPEGMNS